MGYIVYAGDVLELEVEDRLLSHLQIVIVLKFRQNESFMFSWKEPIETGDGCSTGWLSPHISLQFEFAGSRTADINPTWLAALYTSASSGRGLYPEPEPTRDSGTRLAATTGDQVDGATDLMEPLTSGTVRPPTSPKTS